MDRIWIPLADWKNSWHRFKPPHHWHDCGSSEMDWDNLPNQNWPDTGKSGWGNNNGGLGHPQPKPRPPWPRPKPPPTTQSPLPTSPVTPKPQPSPKTPESLETCLRKCPITLELAPVCGTDGITYINIGRLECAKNCGVDVRLAKSSRCPTGSSTSPTPTSKPLPNLQACLSKCPLALEYNPVCGTDGVTYINPGRLECAQKCGVNVQLARSSPCPTDGGSSTSTSPTPKPIPNLKDCISRCPVTPEYNPVCGSDGVTYSNPSRLECAKMCGVNVRLARTSPCPTDGGSSTSATPTPKPSPNVQACISRCPVTPEYNPVCGSDGVTYSNPGGLECAKICGVNVQMARHSRCPTNTVTPSPATTPMTVPTPTISSSTSSGLDFSIPQEILDQIFGTTTEQDTSGLIDERHQDN